MAGNGKSILEQLLEEAMQKGADSAAAEDFAVNISTTDADGTHSIEGIPVSKLGKAFLARFGIDTGSDAGDAGGGQDGQGGGKQVKPAATVKDLFRGGQQQSKAG